MDATMAPGDAGIRLRAWRRDRAAMVWIPGGAFTMGSDRHYPEERPAHRVVVDGFWIDRTPVTNAAFARFVGATGYVTVAERTPRPEDYPGVAAELLAAGSAVFQQPAGPVDLRDASRWWRYDAGACWRHPEGPGSTIARRERHPVVHVAYEDAAAYARWAGKALPTEAQWERAARGGLEAAEFCWGDQHEPGGRRMATIWRGAFPWRSEGGPPGTTPVGAHPPNGYGLADMAGNVWEWTTDFFRPGHDPGGCCAVRNPTGPATALAEPEAPGIALHVLKGGSFLCSPDYCARYRPAARIAQAADSTMAHIGFRCVAAAAAPDLEPDGRC